MKDIVWPNELRTLRHARASRDGEPVYLEQVAQEIGCSIGYLSRLERGVQRPDRELLEALAHFYGVRVDTIDKGNAQIAIDEAKIVGAWIRVERQQKGLSIEEMARALPRRVSSSQVRLIEAGQRAFHPSDELNNEIAASLGAGSAAEMLKSAKAAHKEGRLGEALRKLHPSLFEPESKPRCFRTSDLGPAEVPSEVSSYMREDDYALLVDRHMPGVPVMEGSYCITRAGEIPSNGYIAIGGLIRAVRNGAVTPDLASPSASGEVRRVVLIVPPTD